MTSREQFEAWASNQYTFDPIESILLRIGPDKEIYHLKVIQRLWEAWQASREALEIEIPENKLLSSSILKPNAVYGLKRKEIIEYVRAAGIKVKGE